MNVSKIGAVINTVGQKIVGAADNIGEKLGKKAGTSCADEFGTKICRDMYIKKLPIAEQKEIFVRDALAQSLKPQDIVAKAFSKITSAFKK